MEKDINVTEAATEVLNGKMNKTDYSDYDFLTTGLICYLDLFVTTQNINVYHGTAKIYIARCSMKKMPDMVVKLGKDYPKITYFKLRGPSNYVLPLKRKILAAWTKEFGDRPLKITGEF